MDRLPPPRPRPPAAGQAPLGIRANPMLGTYAATVCAIVHDEMFFLPAFLAHYRRLGADRFIILDDCSTDGTMAFLAAQPDVMVVGSGIRYFAEVPYPPEALARIRETRAVRLWRDQMLDQFCTGQWAVVVDPDEFLALPARPAGLLRGARRRGRRGGLGGDGRHVPGTGARHPRQGRRALPPRGRLVLRRAAPPRPAPAARDPAGAAHRLSGERVAALRHLGRPAAGHARRGGSAAGSRATATRARARSTRPRSSSGARATGS